MKINDILLFLDSIKILYKFEGDSNQNIEGFSSLDNYKNGTMCWMKNGVPNHLAGAKGYFKLVIATEGIESGDVIENKITAKDPKKIYFQILDEFYAPKDEKTEKIGKNTYISPKVTLGENVIIGHNCILDGEITIGDNTIIWNNVTIINKCVIGNNCDIQTGTIIGHDGFNYFEDENGFKNMIKHYGKVKIGNYVNLGCNVIICRGTIDDTEIGDHCKINSQNYIAHNVVIGENCFMPPGNKLFGTVTVGDNCYLSSSVVRNGCKIGKNTTVGMGAVVTKNIEEGMTVVGNPAKPLK